MIFKRRYVDKILLSQWIGFFGAWLIAGAIILVHEAQWTPQGLLAGSARACYVAQVVSILVTVVLIPVALRMHHNGLRKCREAQVIPELKLLHYHRLGMWRLSLLEVPLVVDLWVYYATLDQAGLLCAGMVAVSILFCVPGRGRLLSELDGVEEHDGGEEGNEKGR